jgi:hypothetical protein
MFGFAGNPVVTSLGKYKARITGITLTGSFTIGMNGDGTADVQLPASFPFAVDAAAAAQGLGMADLVKVSVRLAAHPTGNPPAAPGALTSAQETTADANAAGVGYVQADQATLVALLNDLKAKYNALQTDVATLRGILVNTAAWTGFACLDVQKVQGAKFQIVITSNGGIQSPALEIDVEYQHSATR